MSETPNMLFIINVYICCQSNIMHENISEIIMDLDDYVRTWILLMDYATVFNIDDVRHQDASTRSNLLQMDDVTIKVVSMTS